MYDQHKGFWEEKAVMKLSISATIAAFAIMIPCGCMYDTGIPLQNDPPEIINSLMIEKTLRFPDSIICTLAINDLNDRSLSISALPDSGNSTVWDGTIKALDSGLEMKHYEIAACSERMGVYNGIFTVTDERGDSDSLPYAIRKLFIDPFDVFPADTSLWRSYRDSDEQITFDFIDSKLLFLFDTLGDTSIYSTGIRSRFNLSAPLNTSIDFDLRDDMDDAFEIVFFLSTSPDTGKWSGDVAGFYLTGNQGRVRVNCRSISMQSFSREIDFNRGTMQLALTHDQISYTCYNGDPGILPSALTTFSYNYHDSLYVHLKMTVANHSRERHCGWNNFKVTEGLIDL